MIFYFIREKIKQVKEESNGGKDLTCTQRLSLALPVLIFIFELATRSIDQISSIILMYYLLSLKMPLEDIH